MLISDAIKILEAMYQPKSGFRFSEREAAREAVRRLKEIQNDTLISSASSLLDASKQLIRAHETKDGIELENAIASAYIAVSNATGASKNEML